MFLNVGAWSKIPKKLFGILTLKGQGSFKKSFLKKRVFERLIV